MTKVKDKDIIKELMEHGYTKKGARNALRGIKSGMEDVRHGRVSKINWRVKPSVRSSKE